MNIQNNSPRLVNKQKSYSEMSPMILSGGGVNERVRVVINILTAGHLETTSFQSVAPVLTVKQPRDRTQKNQNGTQ